MIKIENLEKDFGEGRVILKNVNAVVNDGDVVGVLGPSGTGKSTLLRCINMLGPATGGAVYVDGENIMEKGYDQNKLRQKISMVFQSFNLFDHMTAIENIMFPQIKLLHRTKQEAFDTGMKMLEKVGMKEKYLSYPAALSGGQKQRVAIARTLVMDPEVILFDEPTSALDPTMVDEVENIIRELAKSGTTMMIVTHEMSFARSICNRIFYMDKQTLYEEGPTEQIFENPTRERTRVFMKNLKSFTVVVKPETTAAQVDTLIREFAFNNAIPSERTDGLKSIIWDTIVHFLPKVQTENKTVRVLSEYDRKTDKATVIVYSAENAEEKAKTAEYLNDLLEKAGSSERASAEDITDDKYSVKYTFSA